MAKSDKRIKVSLKCTTCNRKNYSTYKNKQNTTDKLVLKKFCPFDRKHTEHREVKI